MQCKDIQGNGARNERGDRARKQGCIMHDSDADDFHGKDSGCDRCSEKSRKGSTHAAHDHKVAVFFFTKSQIFTKGISDTATQLQGSTFSSGRTTDQMGQNGADIDEGSQAEGNTVIGMVAEMTRLVPGSFSCRIRWYMATIAMAPKGSPNKR